MTESFLKEAQAEDVPSIITLLSDMQKELNEVSFNPDVSTKVIEDSLKENVFWFLFTDEKGNTFGTCYLQSVHRYWRKEKRFYLGGFYIIPSHRGQGRFRVINTLLRQWAESHGGVQIYAHIHRDNQKSLQSFGSVGIEPTEYNLCVNDWSD